MCSMEMNQTNRDEVFVFPFERKFVLFMPFHSNLLFVLCAVWAFREKECDFDSDSS